MRSLACTPILLVALACSSGDDVSGTGFVTAPTGATSLTSPATGAPEASTGAATTGVATTEADPVTTAAPGTSSGGPPNPDGLPNGNTCESDADCMSGNCYEIPLPLDSLPPGLCAVCDEDADCVAAGLGTSCTVDAATTSAKCTDGAAGDYCQSQAACSPGLYCEPLVAGAEGLLPNACSACRDDADCDGEARCVPSLDVATYTGEKSCALPGSVPADGMCPWTDGDPLCAPGLYCDPIDLGGLLDVAACGACRVGDDATCPMGQVCNPGKFADGVVGASCG